MRPRTLLAAAILMTAMPALAQAPLMPVNTRPGMTGMGHMKGTHVMAFTVTAVDARTGVVEGTADGLSLKLHFPPSSLGVVKPGDQLQVMLAFSK
jgi:hypothetical protein